MIGRVFMSEIPDKSQKVDCPSAKNKISNFVNSIASQVTNSIRGKFLKNFSFKGKNLKNKQKIFIFFIEINYTIFVFIQQRIEKTDSIKFV